MFNTSDAQSGLCWYFWKTLCFQCTMCDGELPKMKEERILPWLILTAEMQTKTSVLCGTLLYGTNYKRARWCSNVLRENMFINLKNCRNTEQYSTHMLRSSISNYLTAIKKESWTSSWPYVRLFCQIKHILINIRYKNFFYGQLVKDK